MIIEYKEAIRLYSPMFDMMKSDNRFSFANDLITHLTRIYRKDWQEVERDINDHLNGIDQGFKPSEEAARKFFEKKGYSIIYRGEFKGHVYLVFFDEDKILNIAFCGNEDTVCLNRLEAERVMSEIFNEGIVEDDCKIIIDYIDAKVLSDSRAIVRFHTNIFADAERTV